MKPITSLKPFNTQRKKFLLAVVLPLLFFATLFLATNWNFFRGPLTEIGDDAAYALQIHDAKHFKTLVGPYSRFGFFHPGPILFYYYAATEPLLPFIPTPMGKHYFAQFLLNLGLLFLLLQLAYHLFSKNTPRLYLFFACLLAGLATISPQVFYSTWPPYVLVLPMLLFSMAAIATALGQSRYFPQLAAAAVIIVQNNLSGAVIVLPLLLTAAVGFFLRRKQDPLAKSKKKKIIIIATLIFCLLAAAPPLIEEFQPGQGNLTKIASFFKHREPGNHSIKEAANFVAHFYVTPVTKLLFPTPSNPGKTDGTPKNIVLLLFLLLVINLFYRFKALPLSTRYLVLFLLLAAALSFWGAKQVPGKLLYYIYYYQYAFAALFYFVLLSGVFTYFPGLGLNAHAETGNTAEREKENETLKQPKNRLNDRVKKGIPSLLLACLIFALHLGYTTRVPDPGNGQLMDRLMEAIHPQKGQTYELVMNPGKHHRQWIPAVGLALRLKRMGCDICVSRVWRHVFANACCDDCVDRDAKRDNQPKQLFFYTTRHLRTPLREKRVSIKGTTIEWGPLKKQPLPFTIDSKSPGEFFVNWDPPTGFGRGLSGPKAGFRVPIASVSDSRKGGAKPMAAPREYQLEIEGHSSGKARNFLIRINGRRVSEVSFTDAEVTKKVIPFDAALLDAGFPALVEMECAETEDTTENSPLKFVFKRLTISRATQ